MLKTSALEFLYNGQINSISTQLIQKKKCLPYRCSTTVSVETNRLFHFLSTNNILALRSKNSWADSQKDFHKARYNNVKFATCTTLILSFIHTKQSLRWENICIINVWGCAETLPNPLLYNPIYQDLIIIVCLFQLCVDRLLDGHSPSLDTVKMQVYFDMNYTSRGKTEDLTTLVQINLKITALTLHTNLVFSTSENRAF